MELKLSQKMNSCLSQDDSDVGNFMQCLPFSAADRLKQTQSPNLEAEVIVKTQWRENKQRKKESKTKNWCNYLHYFKMRLFFKIIQNQKMN